MQIYSSPLDGLTLSNGVAGAYGAVIRQTESPRDIEFRVFELATTALSAADRPDVPVGERTTALHRNRELWQTLAVDLADANNALPDHLRADLLSLAIWVTRETSGAMRGGSLDSLIAVNRRIMQGLRPNQGESASCRSN